MSPNFLPAMLNVKSYLDAHRPFSDALLNTHGFSLTAIIYVAWALSSRVLLPRYTSDAALQHQMQLENIFNICQRGYRVLDIGSNLSAEIRSILSSLGGEPVQISDDELNRAIEFLRLSQQAQRMISLWSGGPRHLVLPFKVGHVVVDLHPIAHILEKLFFKVQHNQSIRGTLFEEEFRKALTDGGHAYTSGDLHSLNGQHRELDAGVTVGKKLIVFECVSVERPLDYEIGNPATIAGRCSRLNTKIDQVLSLVEFVKEFPKGSNYSFEYTTDIQGYVVSPFHEWIWDTGDRLWVNDRPRILSAGEALELLNAETC
jgi:hypothetical protein